MFFVTKCFENTIHLKQFPWITRQKLNFILTPHILLCNIHPIVVHLFEKNCIHGSFEMAIVTSIERLVSAVKLTNEIWTMLVSARVEIVNLWGMLQSLDCKKTEHWLGDFVKRCDTSFSCPPESMYKNQPRTLHTDMLNKILAPMETLEI